MATQKAVPTPKIFVSSTFSDMKPYRDAIRSAVERAKCVPIGMEHFGAAAVPPLEKCIEELKECQIFVCSIGMRYGSIEEKSNKSYTQLEYEYAQSIGMPILAFLVDETKVKFLPGDMDTGELSFKLKLFKEQIKNSSITYDIFDSESDLETKVLQSITEELQRQKEKHNSSNGTSQSYSDGAKLFSRYIHRPALYKNKHVVLKVRFDGKFGSYLLKDEIPKAFGFQPGTTLFLNDLFVLGKEPNVPLQEWRVDCFAEKDAAEWIEDNEISTGTIFTGRFKLCYENIKGIASRGDADKDAYIAKLILEEGIEINSTNAKSNMILDDDSPFSYEDLLKLTRR